MRKKEYISKHDFCYKEHMLEATNKLELRDLQDLKIYINEVLGLSYDIKVKKNMVCLGGVRTKIAYIEKTVDNHFFVC